MGEVGQRRGGWQTVFKSWLLDWLVDSFRAVAIPAARLLQGSTNPRSHPCDRKRLDNLIPDAPTPPNHTEGPRRAIVGHRNLFCPSKKESSGGVAHSYQAFLSESLDVFSPCTRTPLPALRALSYSKSFIFTSALTCSSLFAFG